MTHTHTHIHTFTKPHHTHTHTPCHIFAVLQHLSEVIVFRKLLRSLVAFLNLNVDFLLLLSQSSLPMGLGRLHNLTKEVAT